MGTVYLSLHRYGDSIFIFTDFWCFAILGSMARIARVICPGIPHHITQRGNRRQKTFFCDDDYLAYVALMAEWCKKHDVSIWAWCLMPNHVHLVAVPQTEVGLARAIGEAHRRYTRRINFREKWRGHLWQERFASFPMDESHLLAAVRYVEMNPVAAKLAAHPAEYRWSSARAHIQAEDDVLASPSPLQTMISDWEDFLRLSSYVELQILKRYEKTGRPLGSKSFVDKIEQALGRILTPQRPGPKKKKGHKELL
jgi:putative transposase